MDEYKGVMEMVDALTSRRELFNHHGTRVQMLAMELASALQLTPRDVYLIGVGARLHDLGKLLVSKDLLNATRRLTEVERAVIETHTTLGWDVVNGLKYDETVCLAVRHHHERLDGQGYPDGLMGEQIPLVARIVGLCDAYAALTSDRPYRKALSGDEARRLIEEGIGSVFDAKLVTVFFEKVANVHS